LESIILRSALNLLLLLLSLFLLASRLSPLPNLLLALPLKMTLARGEELSVLPDLALRSPRGSLARWGRSSYEVDTRLPLQQEAGNKIEHHNRTIKKTKTGHQEQKTSQQSPLYLNSNYLNSNRSNDFSTTFHEFSYYHFDYSSLSISFICPRSFSPIPSLLASIRPDNDSAFETTHLRSSSDTLSSNLDDRKKQISKTSRKELSYYSLQIPNNTPFSRPISSC